MTSRLKSAIVAAGLLGAMGTAAAAFPAPVASNANLRWGPSTEFPVQVTVPAGSVVDVKECSNEWCLVIWADFEGFIYRPLLAFGATVTIPYVAAFPDYEYYQGYYYGPSFSFRYYGDFHSRRSSRASRHSRAESRADNHSRRESRASHRRGESRDDRHNRAETKALQGRERRDREVEPEAVRRKREQERDAKQEKREDRRDAKQEKREDQRDAVKDRREDRRDDAKESKQRQRIEQRGTEQRQKAVRERTQQRERVQQRQIQQREVRQRQQPQRVRRIERPRQAAPQRQSRPPQRQSRPPQQVRQRAQESRQQRGGNNRGDNRARRGGD